MQAVSDPEAVLLQRRLQLLIKLKAPTPALENTYGEGVYCMTPKMRVWSRDNAGYAKVKKGSASRCHLNLAALSTGIVVTPWMRHCSIFWSGIENLAWTTCTKVTWGNRAPEKRTTHYWCSLTAPISFAKDSCQGRAS